MKVNYEIKQKDWMAFNEYCVGHSTHHKKNINIAKLIFPGALFLLILFDYSKGELNLITFSMYAGAAILWFIFYPKFLKSQMLKCASKRVAEKKNSLYLGEHELSLSDSMLTEKSSEYEMKFKWDSFVKLAETDNHIFAYISSMQAVIIPKYQLKNAEEVIKFLKSKIKKKE